MAFGERTGFRAEAMRKRCFGDRSGARRKHFIECDSKRGQAIQESDMSQARVSRARRPRPPRIYATMLLLMGAALVAGGVKLVALGGSWYYVIAGSLLVAAGVWRSAPVGCAWVCWGSE